MRYTNKLKTLPLIALLIILTNIFFVGCKTSRIEPLNYSGSINDYLNCPCNRTRNPIYHNPYRNRINNDINENYILNPLDIIEIKIICHDCNTLLQNIQEFYVNGTKLFQNVNNIRLSRNHPFFKANSTKRIKTVINVGGSTETINASITFDQNHLENWGEIKDRLQAIKSNNKKLKVVAILHPQVDFYLYPGLQLQIGWSNRFNYWDTGTAGLISPPPYQTFWSETSITGAEYIQLPVIYNPSEINDLVDDDVITRKNNMELRAGITQHPSIMNLIDGSGYMRLSKLSILANKYFNELYLDTNNVIPYPDMSYLNFQPVDLSWWFSIKGDKSLKVPYTNGDFLVESVKKLYEYEKLRSIKKNASIYLTVFPNDPFEQNFCVNIKNNVKDILLKPGDRVVLSFSKP